ncbi:porin [Wolbachia endosymbiont of Ctenocephalides felis wCfeT]|uniref:porin n=1 Tax=Wolbachia endosymbiont of Ctenocephalides felis wCfeT TaxID=2732593 RepID=UPI0014473FC9|nr:porin [Wolbachia endosymbiont of Ctenocephalides felis wCfeT]
MKLKHGLVALLFLQNYADARVILDKERVYAELDGKVDLKFGYSFEGESFDDKPHDKTSSSSDLRLLYLQRVYTSTQMGFNVKVELSDIKEFNAEKIKLKEGYFIIKNQGLGSIEFGRRDLVSQSMLINTSKIYAAAGGVNGNWANYANLRGEYKRVDGGGYDRDRVFWVKPNIYSNYNGLKANATMSYISPEFYNFKLGLSYLPGENNLQYSNLIAAGLSYNGSLSDDINFTTAVTGEFARENFSDCENEDPANIQCHNQLMHWNFGVNVKFFSLSGIFSCGNGGKSGQRFDPETNNTYYVNAGVGYHFDSRKFSLTYFNSGREIAGAGKNELTSYAISLEYPLAIGTSYYFDIVKFNTKEPKVINNNSGYVLLAGLKLSFD